MGIQGLHSGEQQMRVGLSASGCRHVIVMGASGSGKTTVATALGDALGLAVIEGDDHHPAANVEKMAAGIPLTDADRGPWLQALADLTRAHHDRGEGTVLACSALRRRYRDVLRSTVPPQESFVIELDAAPASLRQRMTRRTGHFMPASLLESQVSALEHLSGEERGAIIDADRPLDQVIAAAAQAVARAST